MINFVHAQNLLWLGVVLPLGGLLWYAASRARMAARQRYGEGNLVDRYTAKPSRRGQALGLATWLVSLTLLIVAASGPVTPEAPDKVQSGSLQVVVVMDVSKSMAAEDYRNSMPGSNTDRTQVGGPFGSRLDMTRYTILQIMQAIQGNPLGIVTYMGEGYPQADLTTDFSALRFVIEHWIKIGNAPGGGSDYARGLKEALATLKRDEDKSKQRVIVLFSDGGFTGDQAELSEVAAQIVQQNVRLIVIGLGSDSPATIPVYNDQNQLSGYLIRDGQVVTTKIEEAPMQSLTAATGGEYHRLSPDSAKLDIRWASALGGSKSEPRVSQIYGYFLAAALTLLFVLSLTGLSHKRDVL